MLKKLLLLQKEAIYMQEDRQLSLYLMLKHQNSLTARQVKFLKNYRKVKN